MCVVCLRVGCVRMCLFRINNDGIYLLSSVNKSLKKYKLIKDDLISINFVTFLIR